VLVIVLIAVPYVHALLAARQANMSEARMAAWESALGPCDADRSSWLGELVEVPAVLDDIPVLDEAIPVLAPNRTQVARNRKVARPMMFGGKTDEANIKTSLTCNERWPSLAKKARHYFDEYLP
jgi:hypothetical protein